MRQNQEVEGPGQDQDPEPVFLPAVACKEFETAVMIDRGVRAAADAEPELDSSHPVERSQATRNAPAAPAAARRCPGKGFFGERVGIVELSTTKRKNMTCYHCGGNLDKGSLRFVYSFSTAKPPRSIHTWCLVQIPQAFLADSIAQVVKDINSNRLTDLERQACEEALATLQSL